MSIRELDSIFAPRRVAVVGASEDPLKVGGRVLHNLVSSGFDGDGRVDERDFVRAQLWLFRAPGR